MADAMLSPAVAGVVGAAAAGGLAWSARRVAREADDRAVPAMGVLGAFVFAAQMVNFPVPGTGSSGHLGGGLLLAILLGPHRAFLAVASILAVQAFLFADGGLLALGCNVVNLGFFPAFVAYPLVWTPLVGRSPAAPRAWATTIAAAVVGLVLGALAVVVETTASGITALPFATFALLLVPLHAAIGVGEGLATSAVVSFVARARPGVLRGTAAASGGGPWRRRAWAALAAGTVALAVAGGWFASTRPDGLEWSIERTAGADGPSAPATAAHTGAARLQAKVALLPDYALPAPEGAEDPGGETPGRAAPWPAVSGGSSLAGLVGAGTVLALVASVGAALGRRRRSA